MRGGIKRSRNGCSRCKEKKLKCDETRPRCLRCVRRDDQCPGYQNTTLALNESPAQFASLSEQRTTVNKMAQDTGGSDFHFDILQESHPPSEPDVFGAGILHHQYQEVLKDGDFDSESLLGLQWSRSDGLGGNNFAAKPRQLSLESAVAVEQMDISSSELVLRAQSWDGPSFRTSSDRFSTKKEMQFSQPSVQRRQPVKISSPSRPLTDLSSMLVDYYFQEVAGLFSCYDSSLNPFRTTVSQLWKSSTPVFYAIQSMAAACVTDVFPNLHTTGFKMRDKAAACIEADIRQAKIDTGSFLALIMLGLSASWHHPNDLGRKEFEHARAIMNAIHAGKIPRFQENTNSRNVQFFQGAMIYWEMLLSYVSSDVTESVEAATASVVQNSKPEEHDVPKQNFPHPWTGIGKEAQSIVFEIGRLVRQERLRMRNRPFFTSLTDLDSGKQAFSAAEGLAHRLLNLSLPLEENIVSPGDAQTPVKHLLTIAEAYRLAGLLQLYRVFPDISLSQGVETKSGVDSAYSPPWDGSSHKLTDMALELSGLLQTIPIESRTRCVQPFLLVAAASELRPESSREQTRYNDQPDGDLDEFALSAAIDVLEARKFVIGRLRTFEHVLPAKPIRQMLDIVKHTWERIDMGQVNVYWMDVMIDKGWETTMG